MPVLAFIISMASPPLASTSPGAFTRGSRVVLSSAVRACRAHPDPLPPHLRLCRCNSSRPTFNDGPTASTVRPISPSPSMRSNSHRGSISSTRSRASPSPNSVWTTIKRRLSPGPDYRCQAHESGDLCSQGITAYVCVLSSFARTIPHPTVVSYTALQDLPTEES